MALRFIYFVDTEIKGLINAANAFCAQKGLGMESSNRVVNVPEVRWSEKRNAYWISITVDVKAETRPLSEKPRDAYQEGGITFNVAEEDQNVPST